MKKPFLQFDEKYDIINVNWICISVHQHFFLFSAPILDESRKTALVYVIRGVNVVSEGDPLEIFTDRDGEVIFKKYSPIGELLGFASQYAETLHKTCSNPVIINDRDSVVAFAGLSKKDCADKKIAPDIEGIMESRQLYCYKPGERHLYVVDGNEKITLSCAMPIISEGDIIGSVATILNEDSPVAPSDVEIKLIQTAAVFLGKQLEE